jgi:hypothetical protein
MRSTCNTNRLALGIGERIQNTTRWRGGLPCRRPNELYANCAETGPAARPSGSCVGQTEYEPALLQTISTMLTDCARRVCSKIQLGRAPSTFGLRRFRARSQRLWREYRRLENRIYIVGSRKFI